MDREEKDEYRLIEMREIKRDERLLEMWKVTRLIEMRERNWDG